MIAGIDKVPDEINNGNDKKGGENGLNNTVNITLGVTDLVAGVFEKGIADHRPMDLKSNSSSKMFLRPKTEAMSEARPRAITTMARPRTPSVSCLREVSILFLSPSEERYL